MKKNKQLVVIILGALVILILAIVVISEINSQKKDREKAINNYNPGNIVDNGEDDVRNDNNDFEESEFRQEVPLDAVVLESGDVVADDLKDIIAVPEEVLPPLAESGSDSSIRIFNIRAEGGKFIPSQITINHNDIVKISISAIDGDYDFILKGYNMSQNIKEGEKKNISFQAMKDGRFMYYCELCGGVQESFQGEIIVVK